MKCENCGKNDVSFVFQSNINGKVEEKHLCHECAEKLGYSQKLQESYAGMQNMFRQGFGSLFSPMRALAGVNANPFFGDSFFGDDFFGGGLLGDNLFNDFFAMPRLVSGQSQNNTATEEKRDDLISGEEQKKLCREREMNALRAELRQAVDSENFERATQLRDQIHAKEKEN